MIACVSANRINVFVYLLNNTVANMNPLTKIEATAMIGGVNHVKLSRKRKRGGYEEWCRLTGASPEPVSEPLRDSTTLQVRVERTTSTAAAGVNLMHAGGESDRVQITFSCPACGGRKHTLPPRSKWMRIDMILRMVQRPTSIVKWQFDPNRAHVDMYDSTAGWSVRVRHSDCL